MNLQTVLNTHLTEEYKNTEDNRKKRASCQTICRELSNIKKSIKPNITGLINPFITSNLSEFSVNFDKSLSNYFIIPVSTVEELLQELKLIKSSFSFERQEKLNNLYKRSSPDIQKLIMNILNGHIDNFFIRYMHYNNFSKISQQLTTKPELLNSTNIDNFLEKEFDKLLPDKVVENGITMANQRLFLEEIPQGMPIILHAKKLFDTKFNSLNIENRKFSGKLKNEIMQYIPGAKTSYGYITGYLALPGKTTEEVTSIIYKLEKLTYDRKTLSQSKYKTAVKELEKDIGPINDIYDSFYLILSKQYRLDAFLGVNADVHHIIHEKIPETDFIKKTFYTLIAVEDGVAVSEIKQKVKELCEETHSKKIEMLSTNSKVINDTVPTYILNTEG